ncbi:MAG: LysM peptidoglycan-binding domain-containing protein [Alphaproteobacteria bacterium]|nr:LysM peptidoglycan-binding domain-containing protein [Alphaproteobacteria bacterium]MBN2779874.1 LysM peptidoglycan-binding domain-containing protein [Alphaproteobacteria bacterium]
MRFLFFIFMAVSFSLFAKTVVVQSGDTLYSLARQNNVSVTDLAQENNLAPPYALNIGQSLQIPSLSKSDSDLTTVRKGESLYSIAKRTGKTVEDLAKWNGLAPPYALNEGQMIYTRSREIVYKPVSPVVFETPSSGRAYVVQPGDTLYAISRRHHISVSDLKKYNGLLDTSVQVGQVLQMLSPVSSSSVVEKESLENRTSILNSLATIFLDEKDLVFQAPLRGRILSPFGLKPSGLKNSGVNIAGAPGTSVFAAEDGVVVYVGNSLKGLGNTIILKHVHDYMTIYAHADKILTGLGEVVKKGEAIATVGKTGKVKSPQLHFEIRQKMTPKNPGKLVGFEK